MVRVMKYSRSGSWGKGLSYGQLKTEATKNTSIIFPNIQPENKEKEKISQKKQSLVNQMFLRPKSITKPSNYLVIDHSRVTEQLRRKITMRPSNRLVVLPSNARTSYRISSFKRGIRWANLVRIGD